MSVTSSYKCDGCGATAIRAETIKGWVYYTFAAGRLGERKPTKDRHFCSTPCLASDLATLATLHGAEGIDAV